MKPVTEDALRAFIQQAFQNDEDSEVIEPQTDLFSLLDSLQVLRTVLHIEQEFGVTVSDGELTAENLGSISRIVAFVVRKQREPKGAVPPVTKDGSSMSWEPNRELGLPLKP